MRTTRRRHSLPIRQRLMALTVLLSAALASGCIGQRGQTLQDIPTPAQIDSLATAQVLTANAPPPDFREAVAFPEVDAGLNLLAGGRYEVQLEFDGVFARTPRETSAKAKAEVWFNQIGSSRRVLVEIAGELLGREDMKFEAVRMGRDSFLLQNGQCLKEGTDVETAAGLRAGTLVGGVTQAAPTGRRAVINGQDSWEYRFSSAELSLPSIKVEADGAVEATGGELWVAPQIRAVVRFYVNLNVTNAIIFDRQLPVSGQVIIRYDLYDAGQVTNITVPFGC